jgi:exonuclease VII large subunit
MFSPRKKSTRSARAATPLDRKQEALREKEEQLKQAAEQLQKLISEAPRLREEQTRRRRAHLASDTRLSKGALVDIRYNTTTTVNSALGSRRLRSEKRDGKFLFIVLSLILLVASIWVFRLVAAYL